jgi:hypothetical protein
MTKLKLTYAKGNVEEFEFDGTVQEYIDAKFGVGGLNPTYATLEEVAAPVVEAPAKKVAAVKKAVEEETADK